MHTPRPEPRASSDRTLVHGTLVVCAFAPVLFLAWQVWLYARNIPNWDEFETVLDYLNKLDAGMSWPVFLQRLFELQNEHRTVTSRFMFAVSYWLTGGVNFTVLAVIGDLFLVGACALLVRAASGTAARLRLAALLGLVVFQLQQHENLFWSGASIDHLLVVLFAVVALAALNRETAGGRGVAVVFATLATFTLAHGLAVWAVGAGLLAMQQRKRALAGWSAVALAVVVTFLVGFRVNPAHHLPGLAEITGAVGYWLALLGASPALGNLEVAPWLGAFFVAGAAIGWRRCVLPGERLAFAVIVFCAASLGMVAFGRVGIWHGDPITSRYLILSALPWALASWLLLEHALRIEVFRPQWALPAMLVPLAFNIAANRANFDRGAVFADDRDSAATRYRTFGSMAKVSIPLFPRAERAQQILRESEQRGIYSVPVRAERVKMLSPRAISDVVCAIDEIHMNADALYLRGWAYRRGEPSRRGDVDVLFRAPGRDVVFQPIPCRRPDVAAAQGRDDLLKSGFELLVPRNELPDGVLTLGVVFREWIWADFTVTNLSVDNASRAEIARVSVSTPGTHAD